jgi:hypothetical protein
MPIEVPIAFDSGASNHTDRLMAVRGSINGRAGVVSLDHRASLRLWGYWRRLPFELRRPERTAVEGRPRARG